ncbi:Lipase 1 [Acrodontium crateriforme]|uniref:Carboxylic ester hydrolase n=1 Tax=Acrodontium crateriforme TaxID=150365 RepID=A0AAQ3M3C0_9PEZI|nr:Lipase 1 [Acrodontium crateriforme]
MKWTFFTVLLGIPVANAWNQPANYGTPTVRLKNGTVEGYHTSTYNQDYFLGVPFAQPPVGELRFRTPQSLNSTFKEVIQAKSYAPSCIGYGGDDIGYSLSEDCLYLNVIRPSGYEQESLPVGVWIHGGGLSMGGTQDKRYNLSMIVENSVAIGKPIIGVSIAYRLSGWGFLASQEVSGSGNTNLGLRDQRLALHWVQENIGAFGGDSKKVTIWGESAGAGSVGWHLTAYNGRDDRLFRAGIMESGNPVAYFSYRDEVQYQPEYNAIVSAVGCSSEIDTLECLRKAPFDKLNSSIAKSAGWNPIVDGDFLARWASIQLKEGKFVKVPIIDGANSDEGTAFGPSPVDNETGFENYIISNTSTVNIPSQYVPALLSAYLDSCPGNAWIPQELPCSAELPATLGAEYRRSAAYFGDVVMIANRRGACEAWAANGVPAYSYRFNTIPNGLPYYVGVTHFQEVAFVFDNIEGYGYDAEHGTVNPFGGKPKSYANLAKLMSSSWASFIYDLDPNYHGRPAGAPDWPRYTLDDPKNIVWDANVTNLAFAEPDTWRKAGIQAILDHALAYRR